MTFLPLPGFESEPETDPDPEHHSGRVDPNKPRDDGGWGLERPSWTDYPPQFKGWRDGQWEAVQEIVAAFQAGAKTVLLDGQTGVGKTYIANGVRAVLGVISTYSCHSLALQDQWRDDFRPYPVLKGRSNYDIKWPGTPRYITAADCTFNGSNPEAGCVWCPETVGGKAACPYEKAKNRALAAPFRCVNHSYLVTESRFIGRFKHPLLILDEAEMCEDAILHQVEVTFPAKLRAQLDLGQPKFVTKDDSIKEWLADTVIPALAREVGMYPKYSTDRRVVKARDAAQNRLDQTRFVLESYGAGWIFDRGTGDTSKHNWALKPVWASHWGAKWIGSRADRILAMSATLVSGEQVALDLGLPAPHVTIKVEGGFDPALRPVLLAPCADLRSVEDPDTGRKVIPVGEYEKLAVGLRAVMARHPRDRILVHTHSYKVATELYARITSPRILMYDGGGRDAALKAYLEEEAAVLLAPSLERGVNLPDDMCRVVVWAKVPFPSLGDPVVKRRLYSGGPSGGRWYAVETIRAVVQGCGRAVRHSEDFAEIYVLDAAFLSLFRKERRLFPSWFTAAIRTNFDTRSLMRDGERVTRIQQMARAAREKAGQREPTTRPPLVGSRPRPPER